MNDDNGLMQVEVPRYGHDCENCVYLGQVAQYDLYYCDSDHPTVIARFGEEGDYMSGLGFANDGGLEPLIEAKHRAKERGYGE